MRFLTRNLLWKLLAVAIAFAYWLNVSNEPELATIVSVPVEYKNFPKSLEISSDIIESIDVEARGPSGLLSSLPNSGIAAILDFSSITSPGERTFTLMPDQLRLPRGVQLVRTIPAQLRFTFEERATRKVPVSVPFSGMLPEGLTVDKLDVDPPELEVVGPQSHVMALGTLDSDPFDLTGVTTDTERTLSVYEAEPEVRIVGKPQVSVGIHISRKGSKSPEASNGKTAIRH